MKTIRYWHKDNHIGDRIVWSPEIDPDMCGQLILNQYAKVIQWYRNTDIHMDDKKKSQHLNCHTQVSRNGSYT